MAKTAKEQETKSTVRFSGKLTRHASKAGGTGASAATITLPKGASAELSLSPQHDVIMVEGTINGFPFRTTLEALANGEGSHRLKLSRALQDAAGADIDDSVMLEMTRIGDEPECRMPKDLRNAFDAAPSAQAAELWAQWVDITPMARRDWILWITSAKQEETRTRRIENACDMLASGKRRPCCMPGINWRTKDCDITSDETWLTLPKSKSRSSPPARSTK